VLRCRSSAGSQRPCCEAVLTFTCAPEALRGFRCGAMPANPPSAAYLATIRRGLVQTGMEERAARDYLRERCDAPLSAGGGGGGMLN